MIIAMQSLGTDARKRVRRLQFEAKLPRFLPWGAGVIVTNLYTQTVKRIPSLRNCYQIEVPDVKLILESGASDGCVELLWNVTIDSQTGDVVASPMFRGRQCEGAQQPSQEVFERLGILSRHIGKISPAPLLRLFPEAAQRASKPIMELPDVWGTREEVVRARGRIMVALLDL